MDMDNSWIQVPVVQTLTVLSNDGTGDTTCVYQDVDTSDTGYLNLCDNMRSGQMDNHTQHEQMTSAAGADGISETSSPQNSSVTSGVNHRLRHNDKSKIRSKSIGIKSLPSGVKVPYKRPKLIRSSDVKFPSCGETKERLESGEYYVRSRGTSGSSGGSEVWSIFEEIASYASHEFTGMVRCKICLFICRYHGTITGTSHMRRHKCFTDGNPEALQKCRERLKKKDKSSTAQFNQRNFGLNKLNRHETIKSSSTRRHSIDSNHLQKQQHHISETSKTDGSLPPNLKKMSTEVSKHLSDAVEKIFQAAYDTCSKSNHNTKSKPVDFKTSCPADKSFEARIDVTGFRPSDVSVSIIESNYVEVNAVKQMFNRTLDKTKILRHLYYKYLLPEDINPDTLESSITDHILVITAKRQANKPKGVPIINFNEKVSEDNHEEDARSSDDSFDMNQDDGELLYHEKLE